MWWNAEDTRSPAALVHSSLPPYYGYAVYTCCVVHPVCHILYLSICWCSAAMTVCTIGYPITIVRHTVHPLLCISIYLVCTSYGCLYIGYPITMVCHTLYPYVYTYTVPLYIYSIWDAIPTPSSYTLYIGYPVGTIYI